MLVFISGISFATTCSYDAFIQSCAKCSFDANGKMDGACSDSYQTSAKTCLGTDFPVMSTKYMFGSCPQIDECVSRLTACKEANRQGSNRQECSNLGSQNCFAKADMCAEAANQICAEGKNESEVGWDNEGYAGYPEPAQNITQPNVNQPDQYENMTQKEAALTIKDFACGEEFFILLLLLTFLFAGNK